MIFIVVVIGDKTFILTNLILIIDKFRLFDHFWSLAVSNSTPGIDRVRLATFIQNENGND